MCRYKAVVAAIFLAYGAPMPGMAQQSTSAAPAAASSAPATPKELVGKSLEDLQHGAIGPALEDDVTALRRGPLLIHGNYCGIGNRPGTPTIDALDEACMHHDACTKTGTLPPCACDHRLRVAATAIAEDPATPPDERAVAVATAAAMAVLICK